MLPVYIACIFLVSLCHSAPNSVSWTALKAASRNDDHALRFDSVKPEELEEAWSTFKDDHGKSYLSGEEETVRKLIFSENLKKIEIHNYLHSKGLKSYTMGVNQFTDLTVEEFSKQMNGLRINGNRTGGSTYLSPNVKIDLPDEVDWRTKGYVTPVKDQGQCGSCWAFSSTGSLEGQHFRKTGSLVSLSEQNLVDCSLAYGNQGCNGGLMDNAFKYIKDNRGIDTEISYPYEAKDDTCRFNKANVGASDTGYTDITAGDEDALKEAVATIGPISVAIDASHMSFQSYKSGIYNEPDCSTSQLDHGVLVVGYGTMDGSDYWLVKNSWNTIWGDQGYIKMSRNQNNQCGIASMASYPNV